MQTYEPIPKTQNFTNAELIAEIDRLQSKTPDGVSTVHENGQISVLTEALSHRDIDLVDVELGETKLHESYQ